MKTRTGFISNSSSTSFIITNLTNEQKTLVDFVKENPQLIQLFVEQYDWYKNDPEFTQENLIESAQSNNLVWKPNEKKYCVFGDEQDTLIGEVFDYILRNGGSSESFDWQFEEYLR